LRAALAQRFEIGAHPLAPASETHEAHGALTLTRLGFRSAAGELVRGLMLGPADCLPRPAVLYLHAHGNRHAIGCTELVEGRPALLGPLGPVLAGLGMRVLCLDLPCFGLRAGADPVAAESAAAKAALWHGRSLAGQMLGESAAALGWLAARPEVDAGRLALFGLSMGATLAYWLGAVDPRPRAVAHLCCLADFGALIDLGAHDLHGPYLTVPSLLTIAGNGRIAGLIAPRAQFVGLGDRDPLTPPEAAAPALAALRAAYAAAPARLSIHREPDTGHAETAPMRAALLAFLAAHLGPFPPMP
jgi:dienelactone hydrolase